MSSLLRNSTLETVFRPFPRVMLVVQGCAWCIPGAAEDKPMHTRGCVCLGGLIMQLKTILCQELREAFHVRSLSQSFYETVLSRVKCKKQFEQESPSIMALHKSQEQFVAAKGFRV